MTRFWFNKRSQTVVAGADALPWSSKTRISAHAQDCSVNAGENGCSPVVSLPAPIFPQAYYLLRNNRGWRTRLVAQFDCFAP